MNLGTLMVKDFFGQGDFLPGQVVTISVSCGGRPAHRNFLNSKPFLQMLEGRVCC